MGLFDIFKKEKGNSLTADNGISGPTFFDGLTEDIVNPINLQKHEWRRKLKSPSGQTKFKIKYYGKLHEEYQNLIVGTNYAPALVVAVDVSNGLEILLFDGCQHGYNALFCDEYSKEQIENRPATNLYKDENGNDTFEIIISTYNGIDYEEEFSHEVDDEGFIKLINRTKIEFEKARRNGFDTLQIFGLTDQGVMVEIVSEELA